MSGRVTVSNTPTVILTESTSGHKHREYARLQNIPGGNNVWLALRSIPEVNKGILLQPGDVYEINRTNLTGAKVSGICESGKSTDILVQEGN